MRAPLPPFALLALPAFALSALSALSMAGCGDPGAAMEIIDVRAFRGAEDRVFVDVDLLAREGLGGNVGKYCVRAAFGSEEALECFTDMRDGDTRTVRLVSPRAVSAGTPLVIRLRWASEERRRDLLARDLRAGRTPLVVLAALALAPALAGCRVGRAASRGFSALFTSPKKVTQNTHPVGKDARLAVVWVGHATALVQIDDKVVLTDPVFTASVGQLAHRLVEPGIAPKDLPPLDAVLVSHMHFDHLSLGSLEAIEPKVRALLLPRGGTAYLTDGFSFPAYELPTWRAWEKDGLRVTAVPVNHVGFRYGVDDAWMKDAFTGYVVEYHGIKVYFGGDTAYDQKLFVETGERFPGLDLALLPIAPIEPRDLMRLTHMDPREALQAFLDLGASRMVPIHYDTFVNSTDVPGDALRVLAEAQKQVNLAPRLVAPIAIGERRVFLRAGEEPRPLDTSSPSPPPPPPAAPPAAPKIPDDDDFE